MTQSSMYALHAKIFKTDSVTLATITKREIENFLEQTLKHLQ